MARSWNDDAFDFDSAVVTGREAGFGEPRVAVIVYLLELENVEPRTGDVPLGGRPANQGRSMGVPIGATRDRSNAPGTGSIEGTGPTR